MTYHDLTRAFTRQVLAHTLAAHGGNRTDAARALGLNRTYFNRLLRRHGLQDRGRANGRPRVEVAA